MRLESSFEKPLITDEEICISMCASPHGHVCTSNSHFLRRISLSSRSDFWIFIGVPLHLRDFRVGLSAVSNLKRPLANGQNKSLWSRGFPVTSRRSGEVQLSCCRLGVDLGVSRIFLVPQKLDGLWWFHGSENITNGLISRGSPMTSFLGRRSTCSILFCPGHETDRKHAKQTGASGEAELSAPLDASGACDTVAVACCGYELGERKWGLNWIVVFRQFSCQIVTFLALPEQVGVSCWWFWRVSNRLVTFVMWSSGSIDILWNA